jgi:hypothetical protein
LTSARRRRAANPKPEQHGPPTPPTLTARTPDTLTPEARAPTLGARTPTPNARTPDALPAEPDTLKKISRCARPPEGAREGKGRGERKEGRGEGGRRRGEGRGALRGLGRGAGGMTKRPDAPSAGPRTTEALRRPAGQARRMALARPDDSALRRPSAACSASHRPRTAKRDAGLRSQRLVPPRENASRGCREDD